MSLFLLHFNACACIEFKKRPCQYLFAPSPCHMSNVDLMQAHVTSILGLYTYLINLYVILDNHIVCLYKQVNTSILVNPLPLYMGGF